MTTQKIETIDSRTLMDLELPPIRFIVNRLLPQGLHILAGAAKTGKSWLLLLLSLRRVLLTLPERMVIHRENPLCRQCRNGICQGASPEGGHTAARAFRLYG